MAVCIAVSKDRQHRADDVHRDSRSLLKQRAAELERLDRLRRERTVGDQFVFEESALLSGRLVAVEQEVGDILEAGVLGQVVDLVAAVDQCTLLDGTDGGIAGNNTFETGWLGG